MQGLGVAFRGSPVACHAQAAFNRPPCKVWEWLQGLGRVFLGIKKPACGRLIYLLKLLILN